MRKNPINLFPPPQEKIQGRLDFLKKERQELLEFKVNDDRRTQELLVGAQGARGCGEGGVQLLEGGAKG